MIFVMLVNKHKLEYPKKNLYIGNYVVIRKCKDPIYGKS